MRKFTKQISSLLAVVAAGTVTGGVVNALNSADDFQLTPLTGDVAVQTCEGAPEAGAAVPQVGFAAEYRETQITPTAGVIAMPRNEEYTTPMPGTVYPIGTETSSRQTEPIITEPIITEPYAETELTPLAGVPVMTWPEEYTTTTCEEVYPIGTETSSRKTEGTVACTTTTTGSEPEIQRGSGDIDMNGKTEVTDLTNLSLYMLKDKELNEKQLEAADLTKDGDVNLAGLAHLKMTIMHDDGKEKK